MKPLILIINLFWGIAFAGVSLSQTTTIMIDPGISSSSIQKEGYVLLFAEEFNAFDPDIWNPSGPENDGPGYDDEDYWED